MADQAVADLSLEFGHFYLRDADSASIEREARQEAGWVRPLLEAQESEGNTVSTVVMIDDYFLADDERGDLQDKGHAIVEAFEAEGVRVDRLVRESQCAETVHQLERSYFIPRLDAADSAMVGTERVPDTPARRWLDNGEPGAQVVATQTSTENVTTWGNPLEQSGSRAAPPRRPPPRPRAPHSIHLEAELWSGDPRVRVWSCPILAAWWQLIRLGLARDDADARIDLAFGPGLHEDASPLAAKRTLTVLCPEFLPVEAAVRAILERVVIADPSWRRHLEGRPDELPADVHLRRIGYLFPPPR